MTDTATIQLPDGYNGHTVTCFAKPIHGREEHRLVAGGRARQTVHAEVVPSGDL